MEIISTEKYPIKSWVAPESLEKMCLDQAKNLANLPMLHHHVALMPDAHPGMGMPIGGVIALKDNVIPNAVGVDIGCGMIAIKSTLQKAPPLETRKYFIEALTHSIPIGMTGHKVPCEDDAMPSLTLFKEKISDIDWKKYFKSLPVLEEFGPAKYKLGTLGGGNHFLELQTDQDGSIWLMIHSGSRHLGKTVCDHYNKAAKKFHQEHNIQSPAQLNWLDANSVLGKLYLLEMEYALEYAFRNRQKMLYTAMGIFKNIMKKCHKKKIGYEGEMINIHHNYASVEEHFDQIVWVHRKGATLALQGTTGIIPGSMGTSSYIVTGLGNKESFSSSSHGAGRIMSRTEYNNTHIKSNVEKELKGIVHSPWHINRQGKPDLSEAPSAYKNIDEVMENQKDLVEIQYKLTPLAVLKG